MPQLHLMAAVRLLAAASPAAARALERGGWEHGCRQSRYNEVARIGLADPRTSLTKSERRAVAHLIRDPGTRGYTLRVRLNSAEKEELARMAQGERKMSAFVRGILFPSGLVESNPRTKPARSNSTGRGRGRNGKKGRKSP